MTTLRAQGLFFGKPVCPVGVHNSPQRGIEGTVLGLVPPHEIPGGPAVLKNCAVGLQWTPGVLHGAKIAKIHFCLILDPFGCHENPPKRLERTKARCKKRNPDHLHSGMGRWRTPCHNKRWRTISKPLDTSSGHLLGHFGAPTWPQSGPVQGGFASGCQNALKHGLNHACNTCLYTRLASQ